MRERGSLGTGENVAVGQEARGVMEARLWAGGCFGLVEFYVVGGRWSQLGVSDEQWRSLRSWRLRPRSAWMGRRRDNRVGTMVWLCMLIECHKFSMLTSLSRMALHVVDLVVGGEVLIYNLLPIYFSQINPNLLKKLLSKVHFNTHPDCARLGEQGCRAIKSEEATYWVSNGCESLWGKAPIWKLH